MSQKTSRCVVSIEPIPKKTMEGIKKKSTKSSQSTPVPQESESSQVVDNVPPKSVETKADSSQASEPTKSAVNGKSKSKKEKNGTKSGSKNNGVSDVALNTNGTSHAESSPLIIDENNDVIEEEGLVPNSEQDNDELFPELIYDETSDNECNFDSSSPDFSPVGRSVTRRSQAKIIPTPETPQLINSKLDTSVETSPSPAIDLTSESLDTPPSSSSPQPDQTMPTTEKILKMKELYCLTPTTENTADKVITDADTCKDDSGIDAKNETGSSEVSQSKTETNYSKSRVKVSPYRRSTRISEQYSTIANYSGNNSTQDTDIPSDITCSSQERSSAMDESTLSCSQDSIQDENSTRSYTDSLKSIKGRKSYRPLRELSLRNLTALRQRAHRIDTEKNDEQTSSSFSSVNATVGSESRDSILSESSPKWTPVGHVVGRKRRQSPGVEISAGVESPALILSEGRVNITESILEHPSKRQRLYGYVATPLRNLREKIASSTPIIGRHYGKSQADHKDILMPLDASISSAIEADEQMPMVADIVPGKTHDEHKWCSIM